MYAVSIRVFKQRMEIPMSKAEYILKRTFNAPREMVWQTWTDSKLLSEWYGPGVETIIHGFDLKVDGVWLNEMKWGDKSNYQKVVFKEINAPNKLVWHHYSSVDENWNSINNPMMPDWPQNLLTTIIFEEEDGKTNLTFTQTPLDATDAEIACFSGMMANMGKGWGSGFDIIDNLLKKMT